jgi:hypothetical protein
MAVEGLPTAILARATKNVVDGAPLVFAGAGWAYHDEEVSVRRTVGIKTNAAGSAGGQPTSVESCDQP